MDTGIRLDGLVGRAVKTQTINGIDLVNGAVFGVLFRLAKARINRRLILIPFKTVDKMHTFYRILE